MAVGSDGLGKCAKGSSQADAVADAVATLPTNLRELIREMAAANPTWGEERIADELLLKLGIRVSPRTVGKPWIGCSLREAERHVSTEPPS